jgi:hypothetical protein
MDSDLTANEKMLIVDKFKTIFSYVLTLSDGKYDGANLAVEIGKRNTQYTKMT